MRFSANRLFLILLAVAFVLRLWGVADNKRFEADEWMHVKAAANYPVTGLQLPDHWYHPPLKHLVLAMNLHLAGEETPYGWRLLNVVTGTLIVAAVYLVGSELFGAPAALLAAVFMAFDPLHIRMSRTTGEEQQLTLFFLMAIFCAVRYRRCGREPFLWGAALFIGLSLASKWYFLLASVAAAGYLLLPASGERGRRPLSRRLYEATLLTTVPCTVYLLVYLPWFGRGYGIAEFFELQRDAFAFLNRLQVNDLVMGNFLAVISSPGTWFLKPVISGAKVQEGVAGSVYFILMNSPAWFLVLPAVSWQALRGIRGKAPETILVVVVFLLTYLPFLLLDRPIFLYSAQPLLPFAYLLAAVSLGEAAQRLAAARWLPQSAAVVVIALGLYLYPLICNREVTEQLYRPVLALAVLGEREAPHVGEP